MSTLTRSVNRQILAVCKLAEAVNSLVDCGMVRAIETVNPFPMPLGFAPQGGLPMLSVYRKSERRIVVGGRTKIAATIGLDYVLDATPLDSYAERWQTLQDVWSRLSAIVLAGHHVTVCDDENLLEAADCETVDESSPAVTYRIDPQGDNVYPGFQGTIVINHKTVEEIEWLADRDALPDLLGMDVHYRIVPADTVDDVAENLDVP